MRHCHGESVEVYEEEGTDLPVLLVTAAIEAEKARVQGGWVNLTLSLDAETMNYRLTLYVH